MDSLVTPATPAATAAPSPSRRRRPYFLGALAASSLVLLGTGAYGLWQRYNTPEPPTVQLKGDDDEIDELVTAALKAVRQSPRVPELWGNLGAVLRANNFSEESAHRCFLEAERLAPQDPRWPYLLGLGLLTRDQEAALAPLRRAVDLCGDRSAPRLQLAEVLLDRGELEDAETLFRVVLENKQEGQKAEERTLNETRAHLGLGKVALARNDEKTAVEQLRQAAAGAPRAKAVRAALAQAYHQRGDEKAAAEEQRRATELPDGSSWPDPWATVVQNLWVGARARIHRIKQLELQGLREEAVVAARQAAQRHPNSHQVQVILGQTLNNARNFQAAEAVLREAVRKEPNRSAAWFLLGYSLQGQGKSSEAMECYRRGLKLEPNKAEAHFYLAVCFNSMKDDGRALEEFRTAIHLRQNFVDARLEYCRLLTRKGSFQEAEEQLDEVARLAPADARAKAIREELAKERAKKAKS